MATIVRCPTCHTPVVFEGNPFRPFCSERCKMIDLGAWAGEKYRIPGEPIEQDAPNDADEREGEGRKRPN
ncbi:MAG TPA: DNA gyrase inhibitor YacG [Candidatus Acidoferrales bacterium]|nr:DNA gyrase inhibitor YacG [Candidatus Acidoferrales bacterium]